MQTNFFHRGADDGPHPRPQPQYDVPVTAGELKKIFSDCDDFEARAVRIGLESRLTVAVCWLDGMVSAGDVSTDVLRPLTEGGRLADIASTREAVRRIEQGAVYSCSTRTRTEMDDVVSDLTNGSVALVFDAQRRAVTFEVRTANVRAVSEPTIEKSVSGSKDAFVETLRINTSLVRRKLHTPALLSTGMCNLSEITDALGILDDNGCPEVTILHCNTQYPTPYEDANLTAMLELFDQFGLPVGLSDHTPGWECDVAATVLGAQVIEKHFTLDKSWPGPDQKASLDPTEFKAMVQAVRHVEAALGDGHKHLTASEAPNKAIARKSIVAARPIKAGEVFTAENLLTKRPGDGISPMLWYTVLGQTAKRDFAEDEKIEL